MSILRALFGPSQGEVWGQLAGKIGGRLEDGGFWGDCRVTVDVGEWTVTLDTYRQSSGKHSHTHTRLRAPYVNPGGFRFLVRRRQLFDGLGKLLGGQDIDVGHAGFDEDFVIQGNDEAMVRRLFANPRLRELLRAQPDVSFEVREDEGWFGAKFPDGVDELCFTCFGLVTDHERLKGLFDLFAETLHTLCHVGAAYEDDPGLRL